MVILASVVCLAAALFLPTRARSKAAADRQACLANLGRIGQGLAAYLNEHDRRWPYVAKLASVQLHEPRWPTLPEVLALYTAGDRTMFRCPADRRRLASDDPLRKKFPSATTWFETEGLSYEYWMGEAYGGKKVGEESLSRSDGFGLGRPDQPLLSDFEPFHAGDGEGSFNTLNADLKPRTTRARDKK